MTLITRQHINMLPCQVKRFDKCDGMAQNVNSGIHDSQMFAEVRTEPGSDLQAPC